MDPQFFSHLRFGLVALGMVAGLSAPVAATPFAPALGRAAVAPAASESSPGITLVYNNWPYARCYDYGRCYGQNQWRYRYWNDDWRYRRYYRPYVQPRIYLGVPAYRYVQPRRYYRQRLSSAHVAWCYDRWFTYRAWDNTYQPSYGPRRQCWSPYS